MGSLGNLGWTLGAKTAVAKPTAGSNWKPADGELRRIQISPLPVDEDASAEESEKVIVYTSPTFRFADSAGRYFSSSPPPLPTTPGPFQLVEGGRPVKAEVKLMVKTADVGKQAIEIRSIREFVDLPHGQQSSGPFSRIFQPSSSSSPPPTTPPLIRRIPSPPTSSSASPSSSPNQSPQVPERRKRKNQRLLVNRQAPLGKSEKKWADADLLEWIPPFFFTTLPSFVRSWFSLARSWTYNGMALYALLSLPAGRERDQNKTKAKTKPTERIPVHRIVVGQPFWGDWNSGMLITTNLWPIFDNAV